MGLATVATLTAKSIRVPSFLLLSFFAFCRPAITAPQERIPFRHLTIADGLSQNSVQAIVQDDRGFLWFGTKDGLNRYDGYTFLVFRHHAFDTTSLSDNDITALLVDSRGRLWVGTRDGGLNRFDRSRKTFRHYPEGPTQPITAIAEDHGGNVWIGTAGDGLYRLAGEVVDAPEPVFERYVHDPDDPRSLSHDRVYAVLIDGRGELWVGTNLGLDRLDLSRPDVAGFTRYGGDPASADGLIDQRVTALHEDREGRLWIGSIPGISVFDRDREKIDHYYHRYRTDRYGWGQAVQLLEDRVGRIWLSTYAELMRFDPETETFSYIRHDPLDPRSINSNTPTALFQDRSDVLWVGTNGYGINVHDPKADRFRTFRRPDDFGSRLSGFSVYTLFEDAAGDIWIGAGVLYRWDRRAGELVSFETSSDRPDDFGNTAVWSILEDPTGFLWVGTHEGLYHYEIATGRYRQYSYDPNDPDGLPEKEVFDVYKARDGALWVVTANYLARLTDPATRRFRSYRYNERPIRDQWAFPDTYQDAEGIFWLGSPQGLVRFDPGTESFRRYRHDPLRFSSLSHDIVRSIRPDPREPGRYLWVGTAGGGLNRFDIEDETFIHFTEAAGLPNNVVYGVLADDAGTLWMSTNKGLSRFDPETGHFRNYDADDGLQSNEFNSGAYFESDSGVMFFGGIYGFNYFRPDEIEDNPHVPPVVITGFRRGNQYESVLDSGTVLPTAISEARTLDLSYRDDVITFEFAALDYSAPSKNRYAYRLLGFNDQWIHSGDVRAATYTNLPPGSYVFQVKGSNNDGIWNEEGVSLALGIAPPWWRSWWAYILYALAILATLYGLRLYELNRLRLKSRLEVEQVEAGQLRALDRARSEFFANVSHEFRTPLTLTIGPLDDLRAGLHGALSAAAIEQVELARRNAGRVLELINQILEVSRLESGGMPLRARRLDLRALVGGVAEAFAPLAERKALRFDVNVPDEPLFLFADPEQLEKALSNLLSNALKFTPAGGTVRLSVEMDPETARVAVRDSGPGIPAAELPRVFLRFHRVNESSRGVQAGTGIGLALAKELVELHGGTLSVESEEGFGSTFTVSLPRGRAHLADDQIVEDGSAEPWSPSATPLPLPTGPDSGDGVAAAIGDAEEDVTTVLVVEDNPEVRAYVRKHLAPTYRVLEAVDGEGGLEMARRLLPDIVISDVMMSGMDGYELCRTLKEDPQTDYIPVVLLTARAAAEDRLTGLRQQADDYLTKPFDVEELRARVENLIASRKRLRERFAGSAIALHPSAIEVDPPDERFLAEVREAIEEHLGDETFTVERLARAVAHSRGHLHRRLRELLDETPSDLIRRMRLERAAQLLEADAGSISEIAYAVGFKSLAHFSNRFNDLFGVRPSEYGVEAAPQADGSGSPSD